MRRQLFLTAILAATATAAFAQAPARGRTTWCCSSPTACVRASVDDTTAPTMAALAREGVSLRNSHALFPTFTTANASAMATGHMLGDTGDFSNTIYAGFEVPERRQTARRRSWKATRCWPMSTSISPAIISTRRRS